MHFKLVDLEDFKKNMHDILDHLVNKLQIRRDGIILMTPPRKCIKAAQEKVDKAVKAFADVCVELAKEFHVNSINLFQKMVEYEQANSQFDHLFVDGLHLDRFGAELLFKELQPVVDSKIANMLRNVE